MPLTTMAAIATPAAGSMARFEKRASMASLSSSSSQGVGAKVVSVRAAVRCGAYRRARGVMPVMAVSTTTTTTRQSTMRQSTTREAIVARAGGGAVEINPNDPPEEEVFDMSQDGQKRRWGMVIALFVAFVLCNLDKVNMSVAIVPMAQELGWTTTQKGLVGACFVLCVARIVC
jgi:hypothetical protein